MSPKLIRWGGPAMMLGGILWILTYATEIAIGLTFGEERYLETDASASLLEWLWPAFFMGAIFFLGIGLLGVRERLEGRSRKLGIVGAVPASIAVVAASINLVLLAGVSGEPEALDGLGFLGVIGILLGSFLIGIAALRAKVLPRWVPILLTSVPLLFIPAIIISIPLGSVAPEYVVADFPFPVVGGAMALVGYAMLAGREHVRETGRTTWAAT